MKGKIITILDKCLNTYYDDYFRRADISGKSEASEEIIKEMDKACCEKCKYHTYNYFYDPHDRCEYHHIDLSDTEILKCNDFTEMEGK